VILSGQVIGKAAALSTHHPRRAVEVHAVVLLGFNVVKGLVLGTAVFDTIGAHGRGLWDHSLGCALFSRRIAAETT